MAPASLTHVQSIVVRNPSQAPVSWLARRLFYNSNRSRQGRPSHRRSVPATVSNPPAAGKRYRPPLLVMNRVRKRECSEVGFLKYGSMKAPSPSSLLKL